MKSKIIGEVLIHQILRVFNEYGLTEAEVKQHVIFVSDRGANIRYGLIKNGFLRLTCFAHIMHNLIMDMVAIPEVADLITMCSRLCSYMKNSGLNSKLTKSLKLYSPTRWSSLFAMIDTIIGMYQHVYELLITRQRLVNEARLKNGQQPKNNLAELITKLPLGKMIQIRDFLEPFKVAIL